MKMRARWHVPRRKKGPKGASQKNLRCYIWKAKETAGQRYYLFCKGLSGKRIHLQCREPGFNLWVKMIPLEKEILRKFSHSSILTWEIPWTEKPGRL